VTLQKKATVNGMDQLPHDNRYKPHWYCDF